MTRIEWLEKRKKGIGGSDAACILGLNPWKSNVRLWEEKTGRAEAEDISDNPAVKYGTEAEEHLRQLFILDFPEYSVEYNQFKMIANRPGEPWLFATLDGELTVIENPTSKGVLEIKTSEIRNSSQWQEWNGRIPQHYYSQALHQLLATGYDFEILKAQLKSRDYKTGEITLTTKHYRIEADKVRDDMNYLLQKEIEFYQHIKNDTCPPLILPLI
jgi:putative phage-type endonuclease